MTLLPFINLCLDYSFLTNESNFIINRFLHSLTLNIKDVNMEVDIGYMVLALEYNPSLI